MVKARAGADAVGMSTVPEAIQAAALGLPHAFVTNGTGCTEAAKAAQPKPVDSEGRDNEPFWFLKDGGDDGWDTTNPSEEWRKRHGDEAPEDYGSGG